MNRITKNIIALTVIFVLLSSMFFTMNMIKNNKLNTNNTNMQKITNKMGENMPTDRKEKSSISESQNTVEQQEENSTEENNESSNRVKRERPSNNTKVKENEYGSELPSEPEDLENGAEMPPMMPNEEGSNRGGNDMPNRNGMPNNGSISLNSIAPIYYVVFGVEGFLLAATIVYFIMSNFHKKTLKETFTSKDRMIVYGLLVIIVTAINIYGCTYITHHYFLENYQSNSSHQLTNNKTTNANYSSTNEITKSDSISNQEYTSSKSDENALLLSGDIDVTLSDITVSKTGDSDGGDTTSFYGTNSGVLAKDGANVVIKNATITTDASGANGVFSYGGSATTNNSKSDGTSITISDSKITTTKDNSGGIMTTGGGIMNASNLEITTSGRSSAAIRSDRGGGTVTVDGGTYTTNGLGSPAIYSTADITVKNAKLISTKSEGVIIEGKNSITLENVELTDNNTENVKSKTYKNIFIYQSMSGDASLGSSTFSSKNSTITTNHGDTIYVTNTTTSITLENNKIINNDKEGNFLRIQADSWGKDGSNGGDVVLSLKKQSVLGNIVVDSISTLDMTLNDSSYYEGTINQSNTAKSIQLTLDKNSKIKLTGDSYVSSLDDKDSTYSNIDFNGYKLYVNGKAIN